MNNHCKHSYFKAEGCPECSPKEPKQLKHTSGPWEILKSSKTKHKSDRFLKAGKVWIGKAYGFEGQPVTQNAELLSAAPELLAACLLTLKLNDDVGASEYFKRKSRALQAVSIAVEKAGGIRAGVVL